MNATEKLPAEVLDTPWVLPKCSHLCKNLHDEEPCAVSKSGICAEYLKDTAGDEYQQEQIDSAQSEAAFAANVEAHNRG